MNNTGTLLNRPHQTEVAHVFDTRAQLIVELTRLAVNAPNVPSAVVPILETLVERTAAVGSAYFQLGDGFFRARAAQGVMPKGPQMDAILAHGLPAETPLMHALELSSLPLFFDDTAQTPITAGFPELGVRSLAASPVCNREGQFLGAFLMHTFEQHAWNENEADLVGAVAGTLAGLAARLVAEEQARLAQGDALRAREDAIRALGLAVESRDAETKGHTDRVTELALQIGEALGLNAGQRQALRWGAYLHDIGKIQVPDRILHKPGRLDKEEWHLMRKHVDYGALFAGQLGFLPEGTFDTIRHHHERWDGSGYPQRLAAGSIPLLARIFSVCDVYDALVSVRPYKEAWTHEAAVAEIGAQAGKQFDPAVVRAFLKTVAET